MDIKNVLTVRQVSERLNIPAYSIRRYINKGLLKGFRIGGDYRVPEEAISEFIIQCNSTPRQCRPRKAVNGE